ncbi:MAG: hypothetical protein GXZ04_01600 [Clostridiales bacterium]|nr:hypothetical protein [Clostridiales bacterium]
MKYHIDTIPVWDAMKEESECPLCALRRKTERLLVDRSLGASVMSPDTRIKVNELGFCSHHQEMMYAFRGGNKLGHGLMMLSHLQTLRPKVEKALKASGNQGSSGGLGRLFKQTKAASNSSNSPLDSLSARCLLCDEMKAQEDRYTASLLHLWKTERAFREAFLNSKGLCLPDTARALRMAPELLSGDTLEGFTTAAKDLLNDNLKRLEEELEWFTLKFDYRNADKPWGDSRDALERTVNKLRGWTLGPEPMQDNV